MEVRSRDIDRPKTLKMWGMSLTVDQSKSRFGDGFH